MSQIFHPRFGLFVKLGMLALIGLVAAGVLAWRGLQGAPHRIYQNVEQPVPFSHKHHVDDDGIDCRYCHSTVEDSSFAGMPPISTCMTCHSQLYTDQPMLQPIVASWETARALHWERVHQLPDFVYFNHSIHVAKGVGCESCHGRVDRMPLTLRTRSLSMEWCLSCHRDPAPHLRPHPEEFAMGWSAAEPRKLGTELMRKYHVADASRLTDCSVCHR